MERIVLYNYSSWCTLPIYSFHFVFFIKLSTDDSENTEIMGPAYECIEFFMSSSIENTYLEIAGGRTFITFFLFYLNNLSH